MVSTKRRVFMRHVFIRKVRQPTSKQPFRNIYQSEFIDFHVSLQYIRGSLNYRSNPRDSLPPTALAAAAADRVQNPCHSAPPHPQHQSTSVFNLSKASGTPVLLCGPDKLLCSLALQRPYMSCFAKLTANLHAGQVVKCEVLSHLIKGKCSPSENAYFLFSFK